MNNWIVLLTGQHRFHITDEWLLRGGPAIGVPLSNRLYRFGNPASKKVFSVWLVVTITVVRQPPVLEPVRRCVTYRPNPSWPSPAPNYLQTWMRCRYVSEVIKLPPVTSTYWGGLTTATGAGLRIDYAITRADGVILWQSLCRSRSLFRIQRSGTPGGRGVHQPFPPAHATNRVNLLF